MVYEVSTVSAGANVKAVQRLLGHARAATTLDVHSGLIDDLDAVVQRPDAAAGVPPPGPGHGESDRAEARIRR